LNADREKERMADSIGAEPSRRDRGEVEVTIFAEGVCHILTLDADAARLAGLQLIRAADLSEMRIT
jgi:hypothetical protein